VQIDVRLDEVVLRALEKNPELRYQQVSEVKTCVETIVATLGSSRRLPRQSEAAAGEEAQTESERRKAESVKPGESLVTSAATNQGARFSRMAIVGACWAAFFVVVLTLYFISKIFPHGFSGHSLLMAYGIIVIGGITSLLGFTAPFVTTILGWIAVSQIRRSAGKLYGLWLAVFDGLLFPLLALDGLIFVAVGLGLWGAGLGWKRTSPPTVPLSYLLFVAVLLGILLLLDWLIIRRVWRAVNRPVGTIVPPIQKPDRFWRWFMVTTLAMIVVIFSIAILGLLAAIAIPNFVKARAQSQANAQRAAAQLATNHLAVQNLSFGPVIERVVMAFDENPAQACLDLGSGEFRSPPAALADRIRLIANKDGGEPFTDLNGPGDELYDWLKTSGVDLIGSRRSDGSLGFKYLGQPPHYYNGSTTFDTVSASEVVQTLQSSPFFAGDKPNLPAAYINSMNPNDEATKKASYIVFRTHDGDVGVMKILGMSQNPRGVKIRYKLVQNNVTTVTPVRIPVVPKQNNFGPIIEMVVTNSLNLGTGEQAGIPWFDNITIEHVPNLNALDPKEELLRKQDADVFTDDAKNLYGIDLKTIPVDPQVWDEDIPPAKLANNLDLASRNALHLLTLDSGLANPPTYLFETRNGLKGVLQITGFSDSPRGVTIRYKLVQNGGENSSRSIKTGIINFKFLRVEVPKDSHRLELYFERDTNYGLGIEVTQNALPGPNGESIPLDFWLKYGSQSKWVGVNSPNVLVWRLPEELSENEIQAGVKELEQNARQWTQLPEGSNPEFAHIKNREGWTYVLWSHVLREPSLRATPSPAPTLPVTNLNPVVESTSSQFNMQKNSQTKPAEEIKSRIKAAAGIVAFPDRDPVLAAIATDAARDGDLEDARDALQKMTAFPARDDAIGEVARQLAAAGKRADAMELAKLVTAFPARDALIGELAK
jgi:hypothetical protein